MVVTDTCGTCRFFASDDRKQGACRRHPPVLHILGVIPNPKDKDQPLTPSISKWPGVTSAQWCGDHQPRPKGDA